MKYVLFTLFILFLTLFNKSETFETKPKKHYDVIISINIHEKYKFVLKQLDNISKNIHCTYAVVLNCNDLMYHACKENSLPENVYIHPTILNKERFHGSLLEGIYNNMTYAMEYFTFHYYIVTSSRNLFENDLHLDHLNKIVELDLSQNNIGEPWEKIKNEWHWPCTQHTLFTKYMMEHNKLFYKSPHEGLCFTMKDGILLLDFLKEHSSMRNELFHTYCPCEEFAIQTIIKCQNGQFYDIGNGCCSTERNPTNNPEKGIYKFMYKTNREEFMNRS